MGKQHRQLGTTNRSGCSRIGSHGPLGRAYGKSVGLGCLGCFSVLCGGGGCAATTEAAGAAAAVGGLRAGVCGGPCKHGHRHPPCPCDALHRRRGQRTRKRASPDTESHGKRLEGCREAWRQANLGPFREFPCPREAGLPCRVAAMQRIAEAGPRADASLLAIPPTVRRARAKPRADTRFRGRA